MVWWLELCASTAESMGSVPGEGTKLLQAGPINKQMQMELKQRSTYYLKLKGFKEKKNDLNLKLLKADKLK